VVKSGQLKLSTNQSGSSPKGQTSSSPLDQSRSRTQELVEVTNRDLRHRGHKASLTILKDAIYIRGTFPSGDGTKARKRVPTGLKASVKSVSIAENRLLDLLTEINKNGSIPETLPWEIKTEIKKGYPKIKAKDAIELLRNNFFKVRTTNPKSRLKTWDVIQNCLNKLDSGTYITTDYLMAVVEKFAIDPDTGAERANLRLKLHQYFKRLGTLIELPDIEKIDGVKGTYKPKKRTIPDQEELLLLAVQLRSHKEYGWLTAAMIIYGCRPSEALSLSPNKNGTASCLTLKIKKDVPDRRTALALPKVYVEKLDLYNISRSLEFLDPEDYDPIEAKNFTNRWGKWLKRQSPDLQLYDLRHSWAKRSIRMGVTSGLAAKALGHSVSVFEQTYLSTLDEEDIAAFASKML
tara:strand:+ start:128 stop:1345 length:1218 start_codon:yes stop_codon:yes gene_type:complete